MEWIEIYAACAKAGVVAVPVNFRLQAPRGPVHPGGQRRHGAHRGGRELVEVVASIRGELAIPGGAYVQLGGERTAPGYRAYEDLLAAASPRPPRVC